MTVVASIVSRLLEEEDDDLKDVLLTLNEPETFKNAVISLMNDEEGDYYAVFYHDPADRFVRDMIRQEKSPAEAAELWPFWDSQIEEHGLWVVERGDEFNFDEYDFKKDWDENYRGKVDDVAEYARNWNSEMGEKVPEHLERYINWEDYGNDLIQEMDSYEDEQGSKHLFWRS